MTKERRSALLTYAIAAGSSLLFCSKGVFAMMGVGIKRAGAQRFAIIGTVGPVATVILAWFVLDESLNPAQLTGLTLSLAGGIAISLTRSTSSTAPPGAPVTSNK